MKQTLCGNHQNSRDFIRCTQFISKKMGQGRPKTLKKSTFQYMLRFFLLKGTNTQSQPPQRSLRERVVEVVPTASNWIKNQLKREPQIETTFTFHIHLRDFPEKTAEHAIPASEQIINRSLS